ncbi:hypothetical protein AB4Z52_07915 [Rhizobium sp. 2YAF20]|uniref:hypothetical protein n=1 Tax=Rhizobium sp. 2YAF20 TaxID=3233027 RepID=UPI003F9AEF0D
MQLLPVATAIAALLFACSASAQQKTPELGKLGKSIGGTTQAPADTGAKTGSQSADTQTTMADLVSRGFEIKTAVPNGGGSFVVFMQKDKLAYACEFSSLTSTRCGSIN